ncbi:hypothetical protein OIU79_007281 [Salix purpurea]|uniref:Uncharacterized protein n=1 Tax=Salix purpurea TaxID=77065 RepID=A0A9Q0TXG9_SALPP|nr:hypothetical protein OIU79_007281 [Salix purpurea]
MATHEQTVEFWRWERNPSLQTSPPLAFQGPWMDACS